VELFICKTICVNVCGVSYTVTYTTEPENECSYENRESYEPGLVEA
jgi:hypothetical protein